MNYPKLLIIGQGFNSNSGGGITLSNLFRGWDKKKIAVANIGHGLRNISSDICSTYYQLGHDEYCWKFPFNYLQEPFESGPLQVVNPDRAVPVGHKPEKKQRIRGFLVNSMFYPFLKWLGLFHTIISFSLSDRLKKWLHEYQPQVLYFQVSDRATILFVIEVIKYLKIPSVIHIMDDWPSTICSKGVFKNCWKRRITKEFVELLKLTDVHLSISDAMSEAYLDRYKMEFRAFHNPLDLNGWMGVKKTDFSCKKEVAKILYAGRIGTGISQSLLDIANAIQIVNSKRFKATFHIQTSSPENWVLKKLRGFDSVVVEPFVDYSELPKILSSADMLVIANDFNKSGADYLRYSMPTKASEYMITGVPILVYSPEDSAVSKFFKRHNCGCCVDKPTVQNLTACIERIISDADYKMMLSANAIEVAMKKFNSVSVRKEFHDLLKDLPATVPQAQAPRTFSN